MRGGPVSNANTPEVRILAIHTIGFPSNTYHTESGNKEQRNPTGVLLHVVTFPSYYSLNI